MALLDVIDTVESNVPAVKARAVIKVVGVGGCGGNAVNHMIMRGIPGVDFIVANTDAQVLKNSKAGTIMQIGEKLTEGLGAGADPDVGRRAAEEDRERIAEMLQGANMLFIAAGMGGGTGTGAAPLVAEIARQMNILTVAVVTKPFAFEGVKRIRVATAGIEALRSHVDSLIIIPNDRLLEVLGDDISYEDAFRASDEVLNGAVGGIAEVINSTGIVNVDFADVRAVMKENGMAMMGSAVASGPERGQIAAEQAAKSPLLDDMHLSNARGLLVNITAAKNLGMKEVNEIMGTLRSFTTEEATVIFGLAVDESLGDSIRVTVIATGLGQVNPNKREKPQLEVLSMQRNGTDDAYGAQPSGALASAQAAGGQGGADWDSYDLPPGVRSNRRSNGAQESFGRTSNFDALDIPAFLRKQAD